MVRRIVGMALAIALVVMLASHAHGQELVSLRLALAQGDVLSYTFSNTVNHSVEMGPFHKSVTARMSGRETHRVVEAGTDGSTLIEISYEDVSVSVDGNSAHPTLPATQLRVLSDGSIVGEVPCGCGQVSYAIPLPQDPVGVGASWTRPIAVDHDGLVISGTTTYTVTAIEQTADGRIARIHSSAAGTVVKADLGPLPDGMTAGPARGSLTSDGETVWSVDRGLPLSVTDRAGIQVEMEMMMRGESVRLRMQVAVSGQWELSPLAAVASPRPPLDPQDSDQAAPVDAVDDPADPLIHPGSWGKD